MRLTNHLRDCFLRAVANDIPKPIPPTNKEIQDALYLNFNEKVKAVYDDESLRKCLCTQWVYVSGEGSSLVTCGQSPEKLPIVVAYNEAVKKRNAALQQLKGVAYGVSTLKALREPLPDLVKYMADEEKKVTPGLPVPANVFSDLKAVGLK